MNGPETSGTGEIKTNDYGEYLTGVDLVEQAASAFKQVWAEIPESLVLDFWAMSGHKLASAIFGFDVFSIFFLSTTNYLGQSFEAEQLEEMSEIFLFKDFGSFFLMSNRLSLENLFSLYPTYFSLDVGQTVQSWLKDQTPNSLNEAQIGLASGYPLQSVEDFVLIKSVVSDFVLDKLSACFRGQLSEDKFYQFLEQVVDQQRLRQIMKKIAEFGRLNRVNPIRSFFDGQGGSIPWISNRDDYDLARNQFVLQNEWLKKFGLLGLIKERVESARAQ